MDMVNEIIPEIDECGDLFVQFMQKIDATSVVCVYEGSEDWIYYNVRVRSYFSEVSDAQMGCKENIIKLYDLLQRLNHESFHRSLFFVDADYDDNSELRVKDRLYVTSRYSIESYFVDSVFISEFLIRVLLYDPNSEEYKRIVNDYMIQLKMYIDIIYDYQSFIFAMKLLGEEKYPPSFRSNLNKYVTIENGVPCEVGFGQELLRESCEYFDWDMDTARALMRDKLSLSHPIKIFRGKDILRFTKSYLLWIWTIRSHKKNPGINRLNISEIEGIVFDMNKSFLIQASPYAMVPESLMSYLARMKDKCH